MLGPCACEGLSLELNWEQCIILALATHNLQRAAGNSSGVASEVMTGTGSLPRCRLPDVALGMCKWCLG